MHLEVRARYINLGVTGIQKKFKAMRLDEIICGEYEHRIENSKELRTPKF